MMSVHGESMTVLSEDESWHLLASMALGRLVTCLEGQPAIFPSTSSYNAGPCSSGPRRAPSCSVL